MDKIFEQLVQTYKASYEDSPLKRYVKDFNGTTERVEKTWKQCFAAGEKFNANTVKKILLQGHSRVDEVFAMNRSIAVRDIEFMGMCPHHFLPVLYTASLTYIPNFTLVGLSKVPRFLGYLVRFPMLQENFGDLAVRLFRELADAKRAKLELRARHICMTNRGALQLCSTTETMHEDIDEHFI